MGDTTHNKYSNKAPAILGGLLITAALLLSAACAGASGATGPQGTQGPAGAAGAAGTAGPAGANGPAGPAGPAGAAGPAGVAGPAGAAGAQGPAGPAAVTGDAGMNVTVMVSRPANGQFFAAGERPVVSLMLMDKNGKGLSLNDFSTLAVYMYGPQEPTKVVTAVKLLNASENRSAGTHHYINLIGNNSSNVKVSGMGGMQVDYTLQPVTNELPGTYTVAVRAVKKAATWKKEDSAYILRNTQIGTATVENTTTAASKCASCHLGASNGQFYLHHIDPYRNPTGSPEIDSIPIATCKACHNNNGYASYVQSNGTRVVDNIIIRVHGVHMGEELKNPLNTNPTNGSFKFFTEIVFPQNAKNCTACHVNDDWMNKPSRQACGTCHDSTYFGDQAAIPAGYKAHDGGAQADDSKCTVCHTTDKVRTSELLAPVPVVHQVSPPAFKHTVELAMSRPANGQYYVAGEKPQVTITMKNAATGAVINPNTIKEPAVAANVSSNEWRRANLFVSGPRQGAKPVLTAAAARTTKTYTYANNDFRIRVSAANEDPRITRSDTAITYQLDDVTGLKPGTYTAFVETMPSAPLGGIGMVNFQVGTATVEKQVATNCANCHGDNRMHASYFAVPFNPDICKNCHDYERQTAGNENWTTSNAGYGAGPLSRRAHGVHFGKYLNYPKEVHATVNYSGVIFPQDVRNCVKCHSSDTTGTWKTEPSTLACMSCHDSDAAKAHGKLNTYDPTPNLTASGDEAEACKTCHGSGRAFSPDLVHNIADPYVIPYPREGQVGNANAGTSWKIGQ